MAKLDNLLTPSLDLSIVPIQIYVVSLKSEAKIFPQNWMGVIFEFPEQNLLFEWWLR